ncbi:MAG: hypothetical protein QM711_01040 [Micropruina sp.]|uniref:hypothetical protein n=1 Tax=Micropruina sp. TaxID=2737536 RepID=UPI0039E54F46
MSDHYISRTPVPVTLDGRHYRATVHLASADGVLRCVGIDLRSVEVHETYADGKLVEQYAKPYGRPQSLGEPDTSTLGWNEVNSRVWRELPVGKVVAEAIEATGDLVRHFELPVNLPSVEDAQGRTKPGPAAKLSRDTLRRVAAAYSKAPPRERTTAVRQLLERERLAALRALRESGQEPDERDRKPVTDNRARKAVAAARTAKLLPPAPERRSGPATTDLATEAITQAKARGMLPRDNENTTQEGADQ